MTTIVVDRKFRLIAADKQATADGGHRLKHVKIKRVQHEDQEVLIATCGDVEASEAFRLWYLDQEAYRKGEKTDGTTKDIHYPGSANFHALALYQDGSLLWYGQRGYPMEIKERFFGIGSGSDFALGALSAGAGLREAVKIACKFDANSGLGIQIEGFNNAKNI